MFFTAIHFLTLVALISAWSSAPLQAQDKLQSIPDSDPQYELETLVPAEGFEVNLFASEPMVEKPIHMNWDEKGRLWVVGSKQYPQPKPGELPTGKVYILEDTNGDGKADKSIVFADGLVVPTAVLPGDGGVYVANSTEILHLIDTNGDGKADQQRVVLSGFGTGDTHHLIHTFRWGPDGSFYFNQSIYIYSHVETPHGLRKLEGGGVWRFRPQTMNLEVFARGLVNPWGLRFNQWGQSFLTDGAGTEGINYAFEGATFLTAPGAERILSGLNPGQPKHSGLDIVSGRHLPESWAGDMITNDFRANRVNRFSLERLGSGYVSTQEEDILYSDNVAFRPVDISVGPDGAMYVVDWYNPIIQHGEVDFRDPRRDHENGRIWRISRKGEPPVRIPDLVESSNTELLNYLKLPEAWTRDQSRRLLKERGPDVVLSDLDKWVENLNQNDEEYERLLLEAFWVYQSLDKTSESVLSQLMNASNPLVRAAAVRALYFDFNKYSDANDYLAKKVIDPDPLVRLEAVIAFRKSKAVRGAAIATMALDQEMDKYLDFALWQTIGELQPLWMKAYQNDPDYFGSYQKKAFALKSISDPRAVTDLLSQYVNGHVPEQYIDDVYSSVTKYGSEKDLSVLFDMVLNEKTQRREQYLDVLIAAMKQREISPDQDLKKIKTLFGDKNRKVAQKAITLASLWKLEGFRNEFIRWAENGEKESQLTGLTALANLNDIESRNALMEFTKPPYQKEIRLAAIEKLISLDADKAAEAAFILFQDLKDKAQISGLLSSFFGNKKGPDALTKIFEGQEVPIEVAKAGLQQISRMSDRKKGEAAIQTLQKLFQNMNIVIEKPTMPQVLDNWERDRLELDIKAYGDPVKGELVYRKLNCMSCHAIGGAGGKIGTDLSSLGANAPTDYIMSSILTPDAEIKDGYELNQIVKKNGNVIMGYMVRETESEVVLRDIIGKEVAIPKFQIDTHQNIPGSLMPPGLTSGLTRDEFVDLVGFLSKIGKPGEYRVPTNNYIRYWQVLDADDDDADNIKKSGPGIVAEDPASYFWNPVYSMVSGGLPFGEVPSVEGKVESKMVQFAIDVLSAGKVSLKFDTRGIVAWLDSRSVPLQADGLIVDLEVGVHKIILDIPVEGREEEIKVEVLEGNLNSGRARPVQNRLQ